MRLKRNLSIILILSMLLISSLPVYAAENATGNGVILSTNAVTLSEGTSINVSAALPAGLDASRLTYFVADPNVVSVTPMGSMANIAAFQFTYVGDGNTTVAIFHADNPAVVGYITVNASTLIMSIPKKLGTNHDNYCELTSYTFEKYDYPFADFQDYKYTLKLQFKCTSYEDTDFSKWGCYGRFYDANDKLISTVHLYASRLAEGRTYKDECNVPYNAVRFEIDGFN